MKGDGNVLLLNHPPGFEVFYALPEIHAKSLDDMKIAAVVSTSHQKSVCGQFAGSLTNVYTTQHLWSTVTPPLTELAQANLIVVEDPILELAKERGQATAATLAH